MVTARAAAPPTWPDDLVEYDPQLLPSRHDWHLARAHAAPTRLDALNEIRAAVGMPPSPVFPRALSSFSRVITTRRRPGAPFD